MIDAHGGESRVALKFIFSLCIWQVKSPLSLLPVKKRQLFIVKFYPLSFETTLKLHCV